MFIRNGTTGLRDSFANSKTPQMPGRSYALLRGGLAAPTDDNVGGANWAARNGLAYSDPSIHPAEGPYDFAIRF